MPIIPLTLAQAETLADLMDRSCIGGFPFEPRLIFPNRDNRDNGKRRSCAEMARKGLLRPVEYPPGALQPDVRACREAWAAWRDKHPDIELWG